MEAPVGVWCIYQKLFDKCTNRLLAGCLGTLITPLPHNPELSSHTGSVHAFIRTTRPMVGSAGAKIDALVRFPSTDLAAGTTSDTTV